MIVLPGDPIDPYWNASCSGCTDIAADNYDVNATIDDGSCTYTTDCAGIVNGTAVVDSCGECQQAYIYNFITHQASYVDNANILLPGMDYDPSQEMVVLPGAAGDPYWNASCSGCTDIAADNYDVNATIDDGSCTYTTDCAGIVNGTAVVDSCGECQQAYIYNFITHQASYVDNANILIPGMDMIHHKRW